MEHLKRVVYLIAAFIAALGVSIFLQGFVLGLSENTLTAVMAFVGASVFMAPFIHPFVTKAINA